MLFIQPQYAYLINHLSNTRTYKATYFAHQEIFIQLIDDVMDKNCIVIGSLHGPANQAVELLALLDTLKRSGARCVTLCSPYLGYGRQDKKTVGSLQGLDFADTLLSAVGVDHLWTIEPHNPTIFTSLKVPVTATSGFMIFSDDIIRLLEQGYSIIFPDKGAYHRNLAILENFKITNFGYFTKSRHPDGSLTVDAFYGKHTNKIILYDDILDSGATMVTACKALQSMKITNITICVTHAFFHGTIWHELLTKYVERILCSNSLESTDQIKHPKIIIKNIRFLLQNLL